MTLMEQIDQDLTKALKAKETDRTLVLRSLKAALKNASIEAKRKELTDEDIVAVVQREVKRRRESIEAFQKGRRADLVTKEQKEMEILQTYLPEQMTAEELRRLVDSCIASFSQKPTLGQVMGQLMPQVRGRTDGKKLQEMVKTLLS